MENELIIYNNLEKKVWQRGKNQVIWSKRLINGSYQIVPVETITTHNSSSVDYRKNMQDSVVTLDYRARLLRGAPMPYNPYIRETREYGPWTGNWRYWRYDLSPGQENYRFVQEHGDWYIEVLNIPNAARFDRTPFTSKEIADLTRLVDNKLLLKIKDQKVNAAVAMAEAYKTMDLVTTSATRLASALFHLKNGRLSAAARALGVQAGRRSKSRFNRTYPQDQNRAIARGWLELQYGWMPVLNDIYGAAEHLAQNPPRHWEVVTSRQALEYHNRATVAATGPRSELVKRESAQLIVRKAVRFKIHNIESKTMAQLGFSNPAVVAWETVPFSFVVDWVLPIGNWLASYDATVGCEFLDAYRTIVRRWSGTNTQSDFGQNTVDKLEYEGYRVQNYKGYLMKREKLTTFPTPSFPSFRNPLSPTRLANALALLQSMRK